MSCSSLCAGSDSTRKRSELVRAAYGARIGGRECAARLLPGFFLSLAGLALTQQSGTPARAAQLRVKA